MAAQDSDSEEDFVTYGKPLEQYQEGEQPKKPIALQDQTVKDEKGRYKRFHGAFTGGFSAGYFNTVGTKEGWTPSTFVSSRQGRSERAVSRPEDFMDEEDLGEFGIAPTEILTTDNFASKSKDRIREKARELASVSAPIPGATILDDLIAPAKITIGIQLLRQMGWKEGQGVGPRTKRRAQKQKPESYVRMYGCALPPAGSEGSEDEEDEYVPENVTFAPKDVIQIDFTMKDNVHGLGYRGLDPSQALFGSQEKHIHLFGDGYEKMNSLLRDNQHSRGRKVGMSGQAFGVGALEEEDDDIYGRESLSKYDTVLCEEESGDGLFGWTAPKEYKNRKGLHKELVYVGKILDGYCTAMKPAAPKKVYAPPELPKDYRPVHYFKPVLNTSNLNSPALQALLNSSQKPPSDAATKQSRHHLNSDQRREMLGETPLQGPSSVLELLSDKDRERIQDVKHAVEQHRIKAQKLAEEAAKQRFQLKSAKETQLQESPQRKELVPAHSGDFRPFEKNPEKQKRYETYVKNFHKGEKDALENCLDRNMTEWEREREREEFMRSAMLYKSSSSTLSSRFTRAKYDDNTDKVEVPRDQESDAGDKSAAVKMKMFGKLTRDTFEWHPDKLLCKRFNIPDPYPGSTIVGLPKVKRDKFSVFNFLTVAENPKTHETNEMLKPCTAENKPKKLSRWDVSGRNQEETASNVNKQIPDQTAKDTNKATSTLPPKIITEQTDQIEDEEKRPSIDLFKAIFEDSSDEKSSSSEEESDAEESSTPITNTQRAEPMNSKAPEPEPEIQQPVLSAAPKVKEVPEVIHPEEEFGPKLPPALPSSASGGNKFTLHPISDESVKKQKHNKRDKEKHKLKKGHKHKKEKKKKHKKQKHKNKHKSKKAEDKSSESEDSNTSLSDTEHTVELTPKELLKRLKNLPIPR